VDNGYFLLHGFQPVTWNTVTAIRLATEDSTWQHPQAEATRTSKSELSLFLEHIQVSNIFQIEQ
jgi:hypothetical protein